MLNSLYMATDGIIIGRNEGSRNPELNWVVNEDFVKIEFIF